jgi:hypothetical protein
VLVLPSSRIRFGISILGLENFGFKAPPCAGFLNFYLIYFGPEIQDKRRAPKKYFALYLEISGLIQKL